MRLRNTNRWQSVVGLARPSHVNAYRRGSEGNCLAFYVPIFVTAGDVLETAQMESFPCPKSIVVMQF